MPETTDLSPGFNDAGLFPSEDVDRIDLSAADIEAAYEQALQAVSAAEQATPGVVDVEQPQHDDPPSQADEADTAQTSPESPAPESDTPDSPAPDHERSLSDDGEPRMQPQHVVEAALFVGGGPLTSKRLAKMLGDESSATVVEEIITSLNTQYAEEERPYEIRLSEGGYHLALLAEFDRVRDRVFGTDPKDVKLSQEALEVLAFVAYQQPIVQEDLEETGKANAATVLRQLLRRQLVCLDRGDAAASEVTYSTTPRFLEVFGLRSLDELPLPEDLMLK